MLGSLASTPIFYVPIGWLTPEFKILTVQLPRSYNEKTGKDKIFADGSKRNKARRRGHEGNRDHHTHASAE